MTAAFEAAFDRLHRAMRLLLRDPDLQFGEAADELGRRRLLRSEDLRLLDMCRSLRNFLAHSHDVLAAGLARLDVEPTLHGRLDLVTEKVSRRVPLTRFMVPWPRVRCGRLEEPLEPLMSEMIARDFSHIPIMDRGMVSAVFDERTLFRALASDKLDAVLPTTRLADIVEVGAFLQADPEDAGVIFVGRRSSLAELRGRIALAAQAGDRVSLVVLTETGQREQRPLGLMTIWDLPDSE